MSLSILGRSSLAVALAAGLAAVALAQQGQQESTSGTATTQQPASARGGGDPSWRRPYPEFHLIGNIYYVGTEGLAVYLITTPEGHILLDTALSDTIRGTRDSIERLGFKPQDIKIMISSHAHYDHVGGHPWMKEQTHARVLAMEGDAETISSSRPPTVVDQVLHDGDKVTLGGTTLVAHHTPGHTLGDTTWTMQVEEDGKKLDVVFFGSTTILVNLVGNRSYPTIIDDYTKTYAKLKSLPCDVFLAPHGNFYNMDEKANKLAKGAKPNPFIDPAGYRKYIETAEKAFLDRVARERAAAAKDAPAKDDAAK